MTILHIDNSPAVTGAYKALLSWCLENPQWKHVWVLPTGSAVTEEASKHFKVYELPFVEIGRSPVKLLKYLPALRLNGRKLRTIISKEQPDVLHANDLYNMSPYAIGKRKMPLIVHARMLQRSFPAKIYNFWKHWHLKKADGIIAVSKAIKNDWDNDERVTVIYDPIVIKEKYPAYTFHHSGENPFRFLYLANYISGKGQNDALAAIKLLKDQGITNFTVDFYGGTTGLQKNEDYKKTLETFVTENGLSKIIHFNGPVTDVEQLMKQYDAVLHFSHAESFGMICYEALYYGLPVISSDCGGPAEMIQNEKSGLLLPLGDISAYTEAMKTFIVHPEIPQRLSANAQPYLMTQINSKPEDLDLFMRRHLKNN